MAQLTIRAQKAFNGEEAMRLHPSRLLYSLLMSCGNLQSGWQKHWEEGKWAPYQQHPFLALHKQKGVMSAVSRNNGIMLGAST